MLERWLPSDRVASVATVGPAAAATGATAGPAESREVLIDPKALEHIGALDEDGSVLDEVLQMYLDEAPQHRAKLQRAVAAADWAETRRIAHALKSASMNVGAKTLGEMCRRLERQCKEGDPAGLEELAAAVDAMLERVQPALRKLMRQPA
jgi:HPt (histidine-containing phosphotransfer) domain-containing protein